MDHHQAIQMLPVAYATALRLHSQGTTPAGIAAHLEIPLEAVEPLLAIAHAKLAHLLAQETDQDG